MQSNLMLWQPAMIFLLFSCIFRIFFFPAQWDFFYSVQQEEKINLKVVCLQILKHLFPSLLKK